MSVYIKDMEMPTEEEISKCIIVRHDGEVWIVDFDNLVDCGHVACYPTNPMRAVTVPPHGRLIDADALIDAIIAKYIRHERNRELVFTAAEIKQDFADIINELPTIIEAEEADANGG